jgi:hypothetical protein
MKPAKSIAEQLPEIAATAGQRKALATLVAIVDLAIEFRFGEKTPSLIDIGRTVIAASRALNIRDRNERTMHRERLRDGARQKAQLDGLKSTAQYCAVTTEQESTAETRCSFV